MITEDDIRRLVAMIEENHLLPLGNGMPVLHNAERYLKVAKEHGDAVLCWLTLSNAAFAIGIMAAQETKPVKECAALLQDAMLLAQPTIVPSLDTLIAIIKERSELPFVLSDRFVAEANLLVRNILEQNDVSVR